MTDLATLELDLINAIGGAETVAALEEVRVAALGKSGSVSGLLKGMGAMSPDERREQGPMINGLRDRVAAAITAKKTELEAAELDAPALARAVAALKKEGLLLGVTPEARAEVDSVGLLVGLGLVEEEKEALPEMLGL